MYRYTNVAPYSHSVGSPLSSSIASNATGNPKHVDYQAREASLSETALAIRTVSPSHDSEAITVKDHAVPFTLAPSPAILSEEPRSSLIISRTRSDYSPGVFALDISATPSAVDNEATVSQQSTEIIVVASSIAPVGTTSNIQASPSSDTSETATQHTSTASPVDIGSARTTGIIIGTVLGGTAVLLIVILAFIYLAWHRRRNRKDQTDRGGRGTNPQPDEVSSRADNSSKNTERKRSMESPVNLPLQGVTTSRPRTICSEPIVDTSSMTPKVPLLSRWTSEKAGIPSPAGHPAFIGSQPHLRHQSLFASTHFDHHDGDEDETEGRHEQRLAYQSGQVSPCSTNTSPSRSPSPELRSPGADASAAEGKAQALSGFLFFDSPSSPSSRRPSTRDSSVPCTALSMPPPHRGPPPQRWHTRAGSAAKSRRGSGSPSVGGGGRRGSVDFGGGGAARVSRPPTPPPPLPLRSAARRNSLHDVERPAAWI